MNLRVVTAAVMVGYCGCGAIVPHHAGSYSDSSFLTAPCATLPLDSLSAYVLPFSVGRSYRLIQGNCSSGTHGLLTAYRFAFDFAMPLGDTVVAARAGVVVDAEESFEDGNRRAGEENEIIIQHADGSFARYVHLMYGGVLVARGDSVRQGQPIGRSGDTGMSQGPHLHFDVATCEHHHCATLPVAFRNIVERPVRLLPGENYTAGPRSQDSSKTALLSLVADVQDADYRGQLDRLDAGYVAMERFMTQPALAIHARYWRGFARWRRALNAAGLGSPADSVDADFALAIEEFREALHIDTTYLEAQIGLFAGLSNRVFFRRDDPARRGAFARESGAIRRTLERSASENPRFVFVAAAQLFQMPPERGGNRAEALAMVERAIRRLDAAGQKPRSDSLEPTWGAAELHMLLATLLLRSDADLDRAEAHARQALSLRPHWQAVSERLIPAINERRARR